MISIKPVEIPYTKHSDSNNPWRRLHVKTNLSDARVISAGEVVKNEKIQQKIIIIRCGGRLVYRNCPLLKILAKVIVVESGGYFEGYGEQP